MLAHAECQASVWVLLLHTAPTAWPTHSAHIHLEYYEALDLLSHLSSSYPMAAWSMLTVWAFHSLQSWTVSLLVWVADSALLPDSGEQSFWANEEYDGAWGRGRKRRVRSWPSPIMDF